MESSKPQKIGSAGDFSGHSREELKKLARDLSNGEYKPDSKQRNEIMQMLVQRLSAAEKSAEKEE